MRIMQILITIKQFLNALGNKFEFYFNLYKNNL